MSSHAHFVTMCGLHGLKIRRVSAKFCVSLDSVTLQGTLMLSLQLQAPPTDLSRAVNLTNGLFVCGDHRDTATLDGALKSGRRAAEAVLAATAALPVSSREAVGTTV